MLYLVSRNPNPLGLSKVRPASNSSLFARLSGIRQPSTAKVFVDEGQGNLIQTQRTQADEDPIVSHADAGNVNHLVDKVIVDANELTENASDPKVYTDVDLEKIYGRAKIN